MINLKTIYLSLALTVLCLVPFRHASAYEAAGLADGPVAKAHFKRQVKAMLIQGKFAELDQMAATLRQEQSKFLDGTWKLHNFYDAFTSPGSNAPNAWERHLGRFDTWLKRYPDSVTAKTSAATAWMAYGWEGRGSGFADKVTEEGWRLFRERLSKAKGFIAVKPRNSTDDCPERFSVILNLATHQGTDRFHFESLFHEANLTFPSYGFYYYLDKGRYLLPSWHGSRDELRRFMEETADLPAIKDGKRIYTVLIMNYWGEHAEFYTFKEDRISWQRMKEGFLEMRRTSPASSFILNRFCEFACRAGARATAKELFLEIGDRPYLAAWSYPRRSDEFIKWRDWAFADDKLARRITSFPDGTEDFRQTLLLAKQGDVEAQYEIGNMLQNGELVKKDPADAAKWFLKAAEQGHRDAQSSLANSYFNGYDRLIERDFQKAAHWYFIAAMQGDSNASRMLGFMYLDGFGLAKNLVKAYVWYSQVTQWQEPKVKEIAGLLAPDQLAAADLEAKKIREAIRANSEAAEIVPIDPKSIQVPEFKLAPLVKYEAVPQLELPTGNLMDGVKWELAGGASFDGKTLSINNQGEAAAHLKVIPAANGCVLIATRLRHTRPEAIVPGTPFLSASLTDGKFDGRSIFMGLLAPPPNKKKEGPWFKTEEIKATHFDGVKLRFGTAGKQEGSSTEVYDTRVMIFSSCKEANQAGEEYARQ
jgi:hypothetical protein